MIVNEACTIVIYDRHLMCFT